ncbi:MAG: hypothetical protein N2645_10780 [Clostridia bacterium]|nr:hypothetical protein [Clostridia bacterium]
MCKECFYKFESEKRNQVIRTVTHKEGYYRSALEHAKEMNDMENAEKYAFVVEVLRDLVGEEKPN